VKRFRGGLVFKAHRLVYHSTLGWRVIKKKKKKKRIQPLFAEIPTTLFVLLNLFYSRFGLASGPFRTVKDLRCLVVYQESFRWTPCVI